MNDISNIDWYKPIDNQLNFDYYMPFYDLQIESLKHKKDLEDINEESPN